MGDLNRYYLYILIISRFEVLIRDTFSELLDREHQGFVLHNISKDIIDDNILLFLKQNLVIIKPEE